jgi:hypothetical protein
MARRRRKPRPRSKPKSSIRKHVESLKALDRQYRKFERIARRAISGNRDLRRLGVELDKLHAKVIPAAFGIP